MKIDEREIYLEKIKENLEPRLRLADANLRLLVEREKKLDDQMEEIQNSKKEWLAERAECESQLSNPLPSMKRRLERDFFAEVSERKRGGDPELSRRQGGPVYGLKFQNRNRRKVMVPRLERDGEREFYQNRECEIEDRRDNSEVYRAWEDYMSKGLASEIPAAWDFEKTFEEIQKFLANAPSLEKYGPMVTVYVESGEEFRSQGRG